jgi:hypothetical protein
MLDIEPHIFLLRVAREALTAALITGPALLGLLCLTKGRRGARSIDTDPPPMRAGEINRR